MSDIHVTFVKAMDGIAPVVAAHPRAKQLVTSSGTSQATTITAQANEVCEITASGGPVWVAFGAAPTAAAGSDHLILDGQSRQFGMLIPGEKVAIIDA